ncbi:Fe-S cluster assembly protein SufD [Lactiplantibacillus carotarum]|uniref:Fe-S cluster assembly protein SufD n=1 Tax=Lactiplantibacillus carotarum TaxID=2993456 RepID=UPI00298EED58|nr:Fe-S cluster assembly protein SufD [Lactiplantibacillus carotarum]
MQTATMLAGVQDYSHTLAEPAWLTKLRTQAVADYAVLALPTFEKINYRNWPLLDVQAPTVISDPGITEELSARGAQANFYAVGDTTVRVALPDEALAAGVVLCDLRTAVREHADLLRANLFQRALKPDTDKLTALNAALMTNGFFLYVPQNVVLDTPIEILQLVDQRQPQNYVQHNLVVTGKNSQVEVIQRLSSVGQQPAIVHMVVETVAGANSHVSFAGIDDLAANTTAYLNRRGELSPDAQLNWELAEMNAGQVIADFDTELRGRGSQATVKTIAVANQEQTQGLDTRVTNYGPNSVANIVQRGVILDAATLIFNGIGHIVHGAHGSKADQENRLLMLSSTARGDANPILLIDENDVEAGHAASVGRVDEQQMYYLLSRGIPKPVAQRLVIRGFLAGVVTELRSPRLRKELMALIERRLADDND